MKQILFKYFMLITCVFGLSGCGYLLSLGQLMLDGSCADWNCSKLNPRWNKAVDDCVDRNFEIVKQKFGHKDYREVAFSDIGQYIYYKCIHHGGRYNICKGYYKFRFHDFRHTWASWHVQAGTPLLTLKELGEWETIEMVQKYAHLNADHLLTYANHVKFTSNGLIDTTKLEVKK